ncbi:A/G-specific adenine glycosylase [Paludibacter sp. 221]|uniref:A/G-specific adenine glycosylase n=1 Tax=Paludibacter sp. 221 TaxID=2302939 RepID=UPI0013D3FED6|nr:A/G-specific adenine glycosylase [Paludibacter sp. 221]NDV47543.1 A/G-specific adenine glycosylase [Paludibacter sp. 221]
MKNIYSDIITSWYLQNRRDLPWRNTSNPYHIWISEVILQQTRVNQGMDYYLRFVERFPTVKVLAEADEDEVLKYWQGLGYYSRARNLYKAAKKIMSDYSGRFPDKYEDILSLNGIGEYTAAAVASFAYNQPYATVDGNVYRVLSRLFAIETPIDTGTAKKEFMQLAQELLSPENPALHNQAMMEFGALYCVPVSPACSNCVLKGLCKAYDMDMVSLLPKKSQKTKVTNRYFNYLYIDFEGSTYLQKRLKNDIWHNLYEFPLIESDELLPVDRLFDNECFKELFQGVENIQIKNVSKPVKHVLSHRNIYAQFISISISNESEGLKHFIKTPINSIDKYAVSRLIESFLERNEPIK